MILSSRIYNNINAKRVIRVNSEQNEHHSKSLCNIKNERVKRLKEIVWTEDIDHKTEILKNDNLKDAHIYCLLHKINNAHYGNLIEHYVIQKYNFSKNNMIYNIGDCSKYSDNYEIKTSISGIKNDRFNYVHLKPSHIVTYYILIAYYLNKHNVEKEGELFIFKIPKYNMIDIINNYGKYVYGSNIKKSSYINKDRIKPNDTSEYIIRPIYDDKCWKELIQFRINENKL